MEIRHRIHMSTCMRAGLLGIPLWTVIVRKTQLSEHIMDGGVFWEAVTLHQATNPLAQEVSVCMQLSAEIKSEWRFAGCMYVLFVWELTSAHIKGQCVMSTNRNSALL